MKDIFGKRFGRLVAQSISVPGSASVVKWLCRCDCGNQKSVYQRNLTTGKTKSCGCLSAELAAARNTMQKTTHGKSKTPEFKVWQGMWQRCANQNDKSYKDYGGRGILVCDRWADFGAFLEDMGERPGPEYSIERKNGNRSYEPNNCVWATSIDQNRNKRSNLVIEVSGRRGPLVSFIPNGAHSPQYQRARRLIKNGISPQAAVELANAT